MTHTSMVHRVGNVPMLTLTGPRGKLDLSQGQCAAIVAMAEMHNKHADPPAPPGYKAIPALDESSDERGCAGCAFNVGYLCKYPNSDNPQCLPRRIIYVPDVLATDGLSPDAVAAIKRGCADSLAGRVTEMDFSKYATDDAGDEAAVDAMHTAYYTGFNVTEQADYYGLRAILAAIRRGEVPGVHAFAFNEQVLLNERDMLRGGSEKLGQEVAALRAELAAADECARKANDEHSVTLARIVDERDRLTERVAELERHLAGERDCSEQRRVERDGYCERVKELEAKLAAEEKTCADALEELERVEVRLSERKTTVNDLEAAIARHIETGTRLVAERNAAVEDANRLYGRLEIVAGERAALEKDYDRVLAELAEEKAERAADIKAYNEAMAMMRDDHERAAEPFVERLASIKARHRPVYLVRSDLIVPAGISGALASTGQAENPAPQAGHPSPPSGSGCGTPSAGAGLRDAAGGA